MGKKKLFCQIIDQFIAALYNIKIHIWPWGKQTLNDVWLQLCFDVPFSFTSLGCSIIQKTKTERLWINTLSMVNLPCLLLRHLGITSKLSFIVAVAGFWSRVERRRKDSASLPALPALTQVLRLIYGLRGISSAPPRLQGNLVFSSILPCLTLTF